VTKGSGPTVSLSIDPATNHINSSGYSYDSYGNLTAMPSWTFNYDSEDRLVKVTNAGSEYYGYDPWNRRVWKTTSTNGTGNVFFYGAFGKLMGTYTFNGGLSKVETNMHFAGKLVRWDNAAVVMDRLGGVKLRSNIAANPQISQNSDYYPFGEERIATPQDRTKFATYYRDNKTGFDYAMNRYYNNSWGRFLTPDSYGGSANLGNPLSWNRYAYVANDPINLNDPEGLMCQDILLEGWSGINAGTRVGDFISQNSDLSIFAITVFAESRIGWDKDAADEKAAISAVIMNRWQIVNGYFDLYTRPVGTPGSGVVRVVPDWGQPDRSIKSIVYAYAPHQQFAVWLSPGVLDAVSDTNLKLALRSEDTSDLCLTLLQSIGTVAGFWSYRDQHPLYGPDNNTVFTSFNSREGESKSPYETTIGQYGSNNTFYGVSNTQIWPHGLPTPSYSPWQQRKFQPERRVKVR
jgi:RHS repeat-associated protein